MLTLVASDGDAVKDLTTLSDEERALMQKIAQAIDPEVWAQNMPVPTRADTVKFHRRRIDSLLAAARVRDAIDPHIAF